MSSSFGTTIKTTLFGQSHAPYVGCVIEGLPSGFMIDQDALRSFMARRAPGMSALSTPRKEADEVEIISGLNDSGKTCGAPLALIIKNTNTKSQDYDTIRSVPRPGHADFTAWAKWHGRQDIAGGGHFSARLTAPLCAAGAIAIQLLEERGLRICAHILAIQAVRDKSFSWRDNTISGQRLLEEEMSSLKKAAFPVLDKAAQEDMVRTIEHARDTQDSVGGIIECVATGMPKGVGGPIFDGLDALLARALFSVPAVKAVEVGEGVAAAQLFGSANNDPYIVQDETPIPQSNHAGGILGGISTGAPIVTRCTIKAISSIKREQDSVDLVTGEPQKLKIKGRHDPTACVRAVPVVEATVALVLLDALYSYPAEEA